jgi:hypothetical protein
MSNSISVPVSIKCKQKYKNVETLSLIDCGAGGQFIDQNYVKKMGFSIQPLDQPLKSLNIDGTENKRGQITLYVRLEVTLNGKTMDIQFLVTGLGKQKILLGFPWSNQHNPNINWKIREFPW